MNTKKGFTLIELSIVLLILFLITGGIIGGSKLIEQAQMKKFITEYKKIKKDIREFILVYGSLPGDFHRATEYWGADTVNGDNNGYWNTRQQE